MPKKPVFVSGCVVVPIMHEGEMCEVGQVIEIPKGLARLLEGAKRFKILEEKDVKAAKSAFEEQKKAEEKARKKAAAAAETGNNPPTPPAT